MYAHVLVTVRMRVAKHSGASAFALLLHVATMFESVRRRTVF
jgi:hypothetical protein